MLAVAGYRQRVAVAQVPLDDARLGGEIGDVPQPDRLVPAAGDQRGAVPRDGKRDDHAVVPLERVQQLAGGGFPDADEVVVARGEGRLAVLTDGDREHVAAGVDLLGELIGVGIPHTDRPVVAAGDEHRHLIGRAEGDRRDLIGVLLQLDDLLFRRQLPQDDGAVLTGRGEHAAVGSEGERLDRGVMAGELARFLAGGGFPEADGLEHAAGDEDGAARSEDDRVDPGFRAGELLLPGGAVPHADRIGPAAADEQLAVGRIRQAEDTAAVTQLAGADALQQPAGRLAVAGWLRENQQRDRQQGGRAQQPALRRVRLHDWYPSVSESAQAASSPPGRTRTGDHGLIRPTL